MNTLIANAVLLGGGVTGLLLGWLYLLSLKRWMRRHQLLDEKSFGQQVLGGFFIRLSSMALIFFLLSRISKSFLIATVISFIGGFTLLLSRELILLFRHKTSKQEKHLKKPLKGITP